MTRAFITSTMWQGLATIFMWIVVMIVSIKLNNIQPVYWASVVTILIWIFG